MPFRIFWIDLMFDVFFSLPQLPFRVRWQDVKDLFRGAGTVLRADVALSYDNRSKGHGTVLFSSVEDAQRAIGMSDDAQ